MSKFDIAFKIKAQHGKLNQFLSDMGISQTDLAKKLGTCQTAVNSWVNFRACPSKKLMGIVCELLQGTPEELFPAVLDNEKFKKLSKTQMIYKEIDLVYLENPPEQSYLPEWDDEIDKNATVDRLDKALKTIASKEEIVLRARFGLDGSKAHSLSELGEKYDRTPEAIRMIEKKALQKLRHQSRKKYFDEEEG